MKQLYSRIPVVPLNGRKGDGCFWTKPKSLVANHDEKQQQTDEADDVTTSSRCYYETLSIHPRVVYFPNFLTEEESDQLKALGIANGLTKSGVFTTDNKGPSGAVANKTEPK